MWRSAGVVPTPSGVQPAARRSGSAMLTTDIAVPVPELVDAAPDCPAAVRAGGVDALDFNGAPRNHRVLRHAGEGDVQSTPLMLPDVLRQRHTDSDCEGADVDLRHQFQRGAPMLTLLGAERSLVFTPGT